MNRNESEGKHGTLVSGHLGEGLLQLLRDPLQLLLLPHQLVLQPVDLDTKNQSHIGQPGHKSLTYYMITEIHIDLSEQESIRLLHPLKEICLAKKHLVKYPCSTLVYSHPQIPNTVVKFTLHLFCGQIHHCCLIVQKSIKYIVKVPHSP